VVELDSRTRGQSWTNEVHLPSFASSFLPFHATPKSDARYSGEDEVIVPPALHVYPAANDCSVFIRSTSETWDPGRHDRCYRGRLASSLLSLHVPGA
jgi:hypothetical protein